MLTRQFLLQRAKASSMESALLHVDEAILQSQPHDAQLHLELLRVLHREQQSLFRLWSKSDEHNPPTRCGISALTTVNPLIYLRLRLPLASTVLPGAGSKT